MEMSFKPNAVLEAAHYFAQKVQFSTGPVEVAHALKEGQEKFNLIDVRAKKDFDQGHLPGAISLPEDDWMSFRGLSKDRLNVIYCYSHVCHLAARAAADFARAGFPVMELDGGFEAWKDHDLEIENAQRSEDRPTDEVEVEDEGTAAITQEQAGIDASPGMRREKAKVGAPTERSHAI